MINVLEIAQLPSEVGGRYTTGVGKVVYELSKHKFPNCNIHILAFNIPDKKARRLNWGNSYYYGYQFPFSIFINILKHPMSKYKQWKHYKKSGHNFIKWEFYEANIEYAIKISKPDIIHLHNVSNLSAVHFANHLNIPIITTLHGIFFGKLKLVYLNNLKFTNYITCLTEESYNDIIRYFHFAKNKISIIPNGVNSSVFKYSNEERSILRTRFKIQERDIVFITVASIQERKGQYKFLSYLCKSEIPFAYWIIGKGEDVEKIQSYIDDNNIGDKVKIIGYVDNYELYRYYSAADIYAHVSMEEGQALSEIEANATGLPIIVNEKIKNTVVGNIENEDTYFILDFDEDPNILRDWVGRVRLNKRISNSIFDWSIIANRYSNLYHKVLREQFN